MADNDRVVFPAEVEDVKAKAAANFPAEVEDVKAKAAVNLPAEVEDVKAKAAANFPADVEEVKAKAAANTDVAANNSVEQPCEEITIPKMSLRNMIQVPDNCPEGSEMDENGVCREVF